VFRYPEGNPVHVTVTVWILTICGLAAVATIDLVVISRRREPLSRASAVKWTAGYVLLAMLFAVFLFFGYGASASSQFAAGYVTEYSLSADNLFVFMLLIARFKVPPAVVDRVLHLGIVSSLLLRAGFIAAGAVAIARFNGVFYVFGALLLYTAVRLAFTGVEEPASPRDGTSIRFLRRILPTTTSYDGGKFRTTVHGKRLFTPVVLVIAAISVANVVFALDSIPAVFGITKEAYIVLTANAFAMMGLRQLYFLVADLLRRLVYLDIALAILLAFIGVKLILEALHGSGVEEIGGVRLPVIGSDVSLAVVLGVLATAAIASAVKTGRDRRRAK
jgi:TerC family integral membrane protein